MEFLRRAFDATVRTLQASLRGRTILYELTSRCNLDCCYCYNVWKGSGDYPDGELDTHESLELLLRVVREARVRTVVFTGGEPLLRPDLEDLVRELTARSVRTLVISNGTLLDEHRARSLVAAGVQIFELPLLAADREVHDALVGGEAFDLVLHAVANVRLAGGRVVLAFVATRQNLDQWSEVMRLARALGVDGVMFDRFNPGGEGLRHLDALALDSPEALDGALRAADEAVGRQEISVAISVPIPPCVVSLQKYSHLRFAFCAAGRADAYWTIDPAGRLRPCNHSPTILGDLRRESFPDILSHPATQAWIEAVGCGCRDCEHLTACRGCCKASAEACHGDVSSEDPFVAAMRLAQQQAEE